MPQLPRPTCYDIVGIKSKQSYNTLSLQLQVSVTVLCIFGSLISPGYSNVIDELCMRAQLPVYSPRD